MGVTEHLLAWVKADPWLVLEAILVVPLILHGIMFLVQKWAYKAFGTFQDDMYRNLVAQPMGSALIGSLIGVGMSEYVTGHDVWALTYVFGGLATIAYSGVIIARERARDEERPVDTFSVEVWRRDLDYLRGLRRISHDERQEFEERARELESHGRQQRAEVERFSFRAYWRSRPHKERVMAARKWVAFAVATAGCHAVAMRSLWYLAFCLLGVSMIAVMWVRWLGERMVKSTDANAQIWAAERIRQWLKQLAYQAGS